MSRRRNQSFRTAVVQFHPVPDDVSGNTARIATFVRAAAKDGARLVVVPETATTGYFIADRLDRLAEPQDGQTAITMGALARECGVHLAVGMAIIEGGTYYDSQLLFGPDGRRLATYHKIHLFSAERQWYGAGDTPIVVETDLGKIGLSICYDFMFPDFIRQLIVRGADIVINSTNWISDGFQRETWGWKGDMVEALARTRALENGVWLAMANCVGHEAGFDSLGHSCVVAPSGKLLASVANAQGFAGADVAYESEDLARWQSIATYRTDRRDDVYRK